MLLLTSFLFGFLICISASFARFRWSRRRLYCLATKLPGPRGWPLVGVGYKFLTGDHKKIFKTITTISNGFESPTSMWLGPEFLVFANTPEALKIVLNSPHCINKSSLYEVFSLKKGLIVSGGETWKAHRKILNPAFSLNVLQQLVPIFDEKSKILVKNISVELDKKPFDVFSYLSACSLESLLKGTMNLDRDIQSDALNNEYIHNIEMSSQVVMKRVLNIIYQIKAIYKFTKLNDLEQKYYHQGALKIADEVLQERENMKSELFSESLEIIDDEYSRRSKNFIDTLCDPKNQLDEEEIKDEINSVIAAGHDTSALVISNCLLMLALHPEVQEKVFVELKEVFGSSDSPVEYASLNKLVYLEMVLKETMRLFPVLPISGRKSSGEFEIGDYTIPAGATIVIAAFQVHRNPKYWGEDAHQFIPERFEPERFKKIHPYAYIPFTNGPRICIGWRYGMMFMKTLLANFLRKYEVTSPLKFEELEFELVITLKIVQKSMIAIKKRQTVD